MLTHNPIHQLDIYAHVSSGNLLHSNFAYLGVLVDNEVHIAVLDGTRTGKLADGPLELLDNVVIEGGGDLDVISGDGDGDGLGGHAEGGGPGVHGLLRGKGNGGAGQSGNDGYGEAHGW